MTVIPESMTAIVISQPGGPEVLISEVRPVPQPALNEVLIKVASAGVNRADILQRQGHYPPPKGVNDIPGLEVAGTVVTVNGDVKQIKEGDHVVALLAGGGYAEYVTVAASVCLPIPEGLSLVEAGSLPEAYFTVWSNVFMRGGLKAGESFLVHGGASGIGTTAIQLAKAFHAIVFATAGSVKGVQSCRDLGADYAIYYHDENFVEVIARETHGRGVDLILDMVGGDYTARNYEAAAIEGRIVQIAALRGDAEIDLMQLMVKRLTHTGSTLRSREISFKSEVAAQLKENVWPLLSAGKARPVIDSVFPFTQAAEAHRKLESSHFGKIILQMGEE